MKILSEILCQLHEMNCEDVAIRFGVDVMGHMTYCFKHDDRIESLSFRRNHWRCFSCDIGGDAITFIQEKLSVSFIEACIILPNEYGISIPYIEKYSPKWKDSAINLHKREYTIYFMSFDREIAEFIMKNTTLTKARFIFSQRKRKIKSNVIESSNIHSIDKTNSLNSLVQAQFGIDGLKSTKVLTQNGKYLTINAPSLIIPYYDENSNLISLQTRYLGEDFPDFHISRSKRICCSSIRLYNLQILGSNQIGSHIFITEGITDCFVMLSAGYDAVALPSATSFPIKDLAKIKNYKLYMVSDRDKTGNEAFYKAISTYA